MTMTSVMKANSSPTAMYVVLMVFDMMRGGGLCWYEEKAVDDTRRMCAALVAKRKPARAPAFPQFG